MQGEQFVSGVTGTLQVNSSLKCVIDRMIHPYRSATTCWCYGAAKHAQLLPVSLWIGDPRLLYELSS